MVKRTGKCLCGDVRFTADVTAPEINACHCSRCRRSTGGSPYLSVQVGHVDLTGETHIGTHRASAWGERGFCKNCGSTLFWRMQDAPLSNLAVGLFDDQSNWHVTTEIFVDHRPAWLPQVATASQSTEAQELEKLNAALQGDKQ